MKHDCNYCGLSCDCGARSEDECYGCSFCAEDSYSDLDDYEY